MADHMHDQYDDFETPADITTARSELEAHRKAMDEIQGEIMPHCPKLCPLQIRSVLDALWLCGYAVEKETS